MMIKKFEDKFLRYKKAHKYYMTFLGYTDADKKRKITP